MHTHHPRMQHESAHRDHTTRACTLCEPASTQQSSAPAFVLAVPRVPLRDGSACTDPRDCCSWSTCSSGPAATRACASTPSLHQAPNHPSCPRPRSLSHAQTRSTTWTLACASTGRPSLDVWAWFGQACSSCRSWQGSSAWCAEHIVSRPRYVADTLHTACCFLAYVATQDP